MLCFSAGNPKLIQMNEYLRYKISDELTFSNISDGKAFLQVEKRLRKAWPGLTVRIIRKPQV